MTEPPGAGDASSFELSARDLAVSNHGYINIEGRARFDLVNLECDPVNDRVGHLCLREDPSKR